MFVRLLDSLEAAFEEAHSSVAARVRLPPTSLTPSCPR